MNHQPFEQWLFADEPLSPAEQSSLQEHLRECTGCQQLEQSLDDVERLFSAAPQLAPAPGFTERWQARLAEQQRQKQQLQSWLLLAFMVNMAMILLAALVAQAMNLLRAPGQWLMLRAMLISLGISLAEALRNASTAALEFLAAFPLGWLLSLSAASALLCVLWFATLQKFSNARRMI